MNISQRLLGQRLFEFSARCTFYGHFIAGNGEVEAKELVKKFTNAGVATILSITAEEDVGEDQNRFASDVLFNCHFKKNKQRLKNYTLLKEFSSEF